MKPYSFCGPPAAWRAQVGLEGYEGVRGTVLGVLKKLPDGSWTVFRGMGTRLKIVVAGS